MFKSLVIPFLMALAVPAFFVTSCTNKCGTTTCVNGGTCSSNKCVCGTGYSGNNCGTSFVDPVIGTYNCSRGACTPAVPGASSWVSALTRSSTNGGYTFYIGNFDNLGSTIVATIDTFANIKITPASGTYGVSGTGKYTSGKIKLNYTTSSSTGAGGYSCEMILTKE